MSNNERTFKRDLLYSQWHRPDSTKRYIGKRLATLLKQIDIDWCEACYWCDEPVTLIETQKSKNGPKSASITSKLGIRADLPVYSVAYVATDDGDDIQAFDMRQLVPTVSIVKRMSPKEYTYWLLSLRDDHHAASSECARKTFNVAGGGEAAQWNDE